MTFKQQFLNDYNGQIHEPTIMVVVVKLPSGSKEIITNTEKILSKIEYYKEAYDDNMRLKSNQEVRIISWLFA